ncbi:MAG: glycosyl hydrolase, repeat-containing protein, partial [Candidatus Krumholzibacteriota bacterium]|nr:glycosyl hydrolase, repeat-containing protein [Candidatus Krumholzibacteriota bacterium]
MVLGLVIALAGAAALAVMTASTRDVPATSGKSVEEPQISPMGAYARGDVPIPTPEEIAQYNQGPWTTALSTMSLQGNDVLVHSPTANDFQSETTIAKNGNYVVVGYNDVRGFSLPNVSVSGYAHSSDGGTTWTDGGQLPAAGGSSAVYGDPDVKTWTDPNDQQVYFYYSSLYTTPTGQSSLCIHVSTDGGATWSAPRAVTTATSATDFCDKEFMDVDPETGRIFVSWTNFGATTTMRVTYSDDKGLTWAGLTSFAANVGQGSVPRAAGNSSNVYLTWRTTTTIQLCRSTNNGATWTGPAAVASGLSNPMNPYGSDRIHGFPGMDVYDGNGYVYIVYASRNLSPDFSDIYFTRSTTAGVSWSTPVAINARPGQDRAQFFSWVSVDQSTGRIDAIWYDQINGTGSSDITDVFHTFSEDLGLTWACPTPVTDKPFHAEYGNSTSQPNMGDYNQCVSDGGSVYTSFAKTGEASYLTYAPDTYVDAHVATPADAPVRFSSVAFTETGCTSGDGYIQAGETVDMTVTIQQYSNCVAAVTSPSGTLTSATPGVTIVQGLASFGSLAGAGTTATNSTPFTIAVSPSFPIPAYIDLLVTLSTGQGSALIPFRLETGDVQPTT